MDFYAKYPALESSIPTYSNMAAFPSAVSSGNGFLAIDLSTNNLYESNGTTWILIAGPHGIITPKKDTASGNSATTIFTLSQTPISADCLDVFIDGILRSAYTLTGNQVTFTTAPANGQSIIFAYWY